MPRENPEFQLKKALTPGRPIVGVPKAKGMYRIIFQCGKAQREK